MRDQIKETTFEEMLEQYKDLQVSIETCEKETMTEDDGSGWMHFPKA